MNTKLSLFICSITCSFAMMANALAIQPAPIFSSGCVLQRGQTVPVWGTCAPNDSITLQINGQTKPTGADANGNWRVELDPEPAGGPFIMTITGERSASVVLSNVYFGDVWILTGQSNMFQTLGGQVRNFPNDYPPVPDATDNFDDMRLAIVSSVSADEPAPDAVMGLSWSRWEPGSLGSMSAVGYFFARRLRAVLEENAMGDIPLGFIKVCQGATAIEQWISAADLVAAKAANPDLNLRDSASGFYNGMIAPIQDYAIKGALWYQGEGNSAPIERVEQYPILKRTLVESWREQWSNPDMPFYFVQLAPYRQYQNIPSDELWAWMRESQTACLAITNTAMACIIDGGLQGNIHPPFKDRVGERLARIALDKTYDIPFVCRGPTVQSVQIDGSDVTITFDNVAAGLETRAVDSQPDADEIQAGFPPVSVSSSELAGFALCGSNQTFYRASAAQIISSNQVRISSAADVPSPTAVRYAWQHYPRCNLFNSEGLPAEPFRSDSFGYGTSSGADTTLDAAIDSVIYSNNFSGTEFTAPGIPAGAYLNAQANGGVLEATSVIGGSGLRVDLTSLDLGTITGIRVSADVFATGGNLFMGFGNEASDYNMNANADGRVGFTIGVTKLKVNGGQGGLNEVLSTPVGAYPLSSTFRTTFTYYTDNTADVAVDGVPLATGLAMVSSVGGNTLDYVYLNTFNQATAALGGSTFDNLVIETISDPNTNTSPGVFSINAFNLSDAGGGALAASVGLSSTNRGDIAFILEHTPDLVHSNWVPVATNVLKAPGGTFVYTNGSGSAGFYRISVEE